MEAELWDAGGNEIELKPGHVMVMGKEKFCQVPIDDYEAKMIYRPCDDPKRLDRAENLIAEWGSIGDVWFPSVNGTFKKWTDLNEEIHVSDSGNSGQAG